MLLSRCLGLTLLLALGASPCIGRAGCPALPDPDLRPIDEEVYRDPRHAIELAGRMAQGSPAAAGALRRAQLFVILADARDAAGLDPVALSERDAVLAALATLLPSPAVHRVRLRVLMTNPAGFLLPDRLRTTVAELTSALNPVPTDPAEHSCLLTARSIAEWQLGRIAVSASDAIAARQIAHASGLADAEMQATSALAVIYRWSGLTNYSLPLIDEVAAYARARNLTYLLGDTEYSRGRSLTVAGDFDRAQSAFDSLRSLLAKRPNRRMQSWLDAAECELAVTRKDWRAGESACAIAEVSAAAAGQQDALAIVRDVAARIALERKQPLAALALIDSALALGFESPRPGFRAQAYAIRSHALLALGRHSEALDELSRSVRLAEQDDLGDQNRAVAVLTASVEAERGAAERRLLDERTRVQALELAARRRTQWLAAGLALGATTTAGLLAALVWSQRRNARRIALRDATLIAAASNAPDSLMLLTADRKVRFANRGLVGPSVPALIDRPLADSLPTSLRTPVVDAVDALYAGKTAVAFEATMADGPGEDRQFEFRAVPILDGDAVVGATLRAADVTEARRLERDVIRASTRERALLSRELHEGLGQDLAGIAMLVASLPTAINKGADAASRVAEDIGAHVLGAVRDTRLRAERLSPLQARRGSLTDALESLCAHGRNRHEVDISLDINVRERLLPELTADHLYQIVDEALTQAVLDHGATRMAISLTEVEDTVLLQIVDNRTSTGDPYDQHRSLEMRIMSYRARVIGGSLNVTSNKDGGTTTVVSVPARVSADHTGDSRAQATPPVR